MTTPTVTELLPALAEAFKAHYMARDPSYPEHFGSVTFEAGRKFVRIVRTAPSQRSTLGFVALVDVTTKEGSVKAGDLLKSAGWKTPELNFARGSIFKLAEAIAHERVRWTGIQ